MELPYFIMKKEPIALLFTDLHIKETNIEICNAFLNKIIEEISNTPSIKEIIFVGDFFDNRKGLSEIVINYSIYFFKKIVNLGCKIHVVVGNHDKLIPTKEESYLDFLGLIYKEISIHKTFECIKTKYEVDFAFFSYFEGEPFQKYLEEIQNENFKKETILFSHYMSEQIPSSVKNLFKYTYLGHNHEREDFPKGKYLGSCFQQNFSESNEKGYSLLLSDGEVIFKNFLEKEYVLQKIDLNSFSLEKIKAFVIQFKEKYKNKLLKIELIGYNKDSTFIKDFLKQQNIPFVSKLEEIISSTDFNNNISDFSDKKIKNYFEDFCVENGISENIKETIKTLLNNV